VSDDIPADQTDDERRAAGLSPEPRPAAEPAPKFDGPKPVKVSFRLWVAGSIIQIGGQIYYLVTKNQVVDVLAKQHPDIARDRWAASVPIMLWIVLIAAIVLSALIVLFAHKAREGTRSARTVLTLLAVLTALFYLVIFVNPFAVVAVLLYAIALILLYLPNVQGYFPKVGRKLP
jgi:ABC-type Na+ efflux pump permease subunit